MIRCLRPLAAVLALFATITAAHAGEPAAKPELVFPVIAKYGGVVARPGAVEQPRAGARVVFDCTADAKPGDINKGLERVARLLNLYGAAGRKPSDVTISIVFHGEATKSVLADEAYHKRFDVAANPNLPLLRELQRAGVEVQVCGQALNYKGMADAEVADKIDIAASALTAVINKQLDGFAVIPIP